MFDTIRDISIKMEDIKTPDIGFDLEKVSLSMINVLERINNSTYDRTDRWSLENMFDTIRDISIKMEDIKTDPISLDGVNSNINNIISLSEIISKSTYTDSDKDNLENMFDTIKDISDKMKDMKIPIDKHWLQSLKETINIVKSIPTNSNNLESLINSFQRMSKINESSDKLKTLSESIKDISKSLKNLDENSLDNLIKFSDSMMILSLVDNNKLNNFIDIIEERGKKLGESISESMNIDNNIQPINTVINAIVKSDDIEKREQQEKFDKLIKHLESIDNHITGLLEINHIESPNTLTYSKKSNSTLDDFS
jgi:exonuclease VII small subunit